MGGVSPELMEQAKAAMLAENMDFSEQQEPSARSGVGCPSLGGYIEHHFDFAQATPDLEYLHKQLKSAMASRDSGRKNSSQKRIDMLRGEIKKKLKLNEIAKQDTLSMSTDKPVYSDPRGGSDSEYAEEGDSQDFTTCMRDDGSKYGSNGRCIIGSETSPASKDDKKSSSKSSGGGGGLTAEQDAEQTRQINKQEGRGGGVGKEGRSPVGKKGIVSDAEKSGGGAPTAKEVRALDKTAKAADKKADAADKKFQKSKSPADQKAARAADKEAKAANKAADKADKAFQKAAKAKKSSPAQEARESKDPKVQQRQVKNDIKKLSNEYERLRGKPEAAARRSEIMKEVSTLNNKQVALTKKIDDAAKSQSPKAPRDSSPAGNQRRANAATSARD